MDVLTIIVVLGFVGLVFWSIRWAYHDAESRGKSGWLVGLLILLNWPSSLILWLVFRPEERADSLPPHRGHES